MSNDIDIYDDLLRDFYEIVNNIIKNILKK